ncbi:hypothetical protein [Streptomyces sp. NPDC052042]
MSGWSDRRRERRAQINHDPHTLAAPIKAGLIGGTYHHEPREQNA